MLKAKTAGRMAKGWALPALWRIAAMFRGISWREAVFITTKSTIPRVGDSREGFLSAMAWIAAKPKGVAALPRPSRLAERFRAIFPRMAVSSRYSGNRRPITGARARASSRERPLSSAICKKPSQAHMLPSRNRDSSTADWAPSSKAVESEPTRPVAKALTTLRAIMKNQMEFNILSPSFSQSFP